MGWFGLKVKNSGKRAWLGIGIILFIITSLIFGYLYKFSIFVLSVYGIFALTHIIFQMYFASKNIKRDFDSDYIPKVSVVIPVYNEKKEDLERCFRSIKEQIYPKNHMEVIIINDGSGNRDEIEELFNFYKKETWKLIHLKKNMGKRIAMYSGFKRANGDIIVTIDSDTTLDKCAILEIVKPFKNKTIGAVTGNVSVQNWYKNILTFLTNLRYWLAFNLERSAQSNFNSLACISGVLGAYRKDIINKVKEDFVNQKFMGERCTFGDDRHLTNLVMKYGYDVVYTPHAKARTTAPESFLKWIKQQIRWSRSFYREFIVGFRVMLNKSIFLTYDLFFQALMPFFLLINMGIFFYKTFTIGIEYLLLYISLIIIMGLIRAFYGILHTKKLSFLTFIIYSFIYMFILLPVKLYAFLTIPENKWGTR